MVRTITKLLRPKKRFNYHQTAIIILPIVLVGAFAVWKIFAAGTPIAFETEAGNLAGGAAVTPSTGASGGSAVAFSNAATPTPSPAGFQANCINSPHVCGYPDAANTGVPAGTTLTNVPSQATSGTNWTWDAGNDAVQPSGAGVTISGLNVTGSIEVNVANVTIKNTKITGCSYYPINYGSTGLTVEDTEINPGCIDASACLSFDNYTAIRINCSGAVDGFKGNQNVIVQDSYIHDVQFNSSTHNDGIQSTGGSNVTFTHNTCDMGTAGDCIQFSADSGWTVTNNLVRATGWMFNGGTPDNSTFTGNRFVNKSVTGAYGYASIPGTGNTWSGNYLDADGSAVSD